MKFGYAGENQPRCVIPAIVGQAQPGVDVVGIYAKACFVGHEALAKRSLLTLTNPVEDGLVTSWPLLQELWQEVFVNKLHVDIEEFSIITGEKPFVPNSSREKMIQLAFETFKVNGFYSMQQSVLALHSLGRTTGIVLDAGDGQIRVVPVYEGYTLPHAVIETPMKGGSLDAYLSKLLGGEVPASGVRFIKEKACYIPLDFQAECQNPGEKLDPVVLPGGAVVDVGQARFRCPELLFDPSLDEQPGDGIHQVVFNSIMRCDIDIRKDLYKSVLLAGGSTMCQGFGERMEKEIIALAPPSMNVRVFAPPVRRYAVWLGGAVLGGSDFFHESMVLHREQYKEQGAGIVHKLCHS